jgi:hypothetical protein
MSRAASVLIITLVALSGAACGSAPIEESPILLPERRYAEDASASGDAPSDSSDPDSDWDAGLDGAAPAAASPGMTCSSASAYPAAIGQALDEGSSPLKSIAPWANASDAAALDGAWASVSLYSDRTMSSVLVADRFDLAVPAGAAITGVVVEVTRATASTKVSDRKVQLSLKGAAIGSDSAKTTPWLAKTVKAVYGASSDLWAAALDRAKVTDPSFGVRFGVYHEDTSSIARVDAIKLTVHYCR